MKKEPKLYTVEITDTAWDMLIEHAKFLARVDLPTANKLVDAFLEVTESLAEMPERNPWLEGKSIPRQRYRKQLFPNGI